MIHDVNIGIELASEHGGRSTRNVTARDNLVYDSTAIGIAIGGYDRDRGSTEDCTIVRNTVVNTDGPELLLQFDTRRNVIRENVIVAGPRHIFVENPCEENVDNVLDANLYHALDGISAGTWRWRGIDHGDFDRWQAGSGNDPSSAFADPVFVNVAEHDYRLEEGSPAIGIGASPGVTGSALGRPPRAALGGVGPEHEAQEEGGRQGGGREERDHADERQPEDDRPER